MAAHILHILHQIFFKKSSAQIEQLQASLNGSVVRRSHFDITFAITVKAIFIFIFIKT